METKPLPSWLATALVFSASGSVLVLEIVTLRLVRWGGEVLRGGAAPAVLLLAAMAVFLPAFLLAGITPLVVKLQLGDLRKTGQVVGRLSSFGTLGAITATLGTGFIFVAALPSSAIILTLAGVLAVCG